MNTLPFDPRRTPARPDLAAAHLRDRIKAPHYAAGEPRQVSAPVAPVRSAPRFDAPLLTEALSGELITVYDVKDGWAWCQLAADGYVGYMTADCLTTMIEDTTHKVSGRATFVYPAPDIKAPPFMRMSFSSELIVYGQDGKFAELSRGGFVFAGHIVSKQERARDYVRVAERLAGTPYLWGGKTSNGLDCSALVQLSLQAAGFTACPRDSDMQEAELGEALAKADLGAVQRGDLLFWKGHVAIATSPDFLIHANAWHMETAIEPIKRAVERIGPVTSIRRVALPEHDVAPPETVMDLPAPEAVAVPQKKMAALTQELQKAVPQTPSPVPPKTGPAVPAAPELPPEFIAQPGVPPSPAPAAPAKPSAVVPPQAPSPAPNPPAPETARPAAQQPK